MLITLPVMPEEFSEADMEVIVMSEKEYKEQKNKKENEIKKEDLKKVNGGIHVVDIDDVPDKPSDIPYFR